MDNFLYLPRADTFVVKNLHDIYRKYRVPGLRESDYYSGTGIEQTYNMSVTDDDLPGCDEAVPALIEVDIGNGQTKGIMRKSVEHSTRKCSDCGTDCRKDGGEIFCPECGLVESDDPEMDRTPQAAGFVYE